MGGLPECGIALRIKPLRLPPESYREVRARFERRFAQSTGRLSPVFPGGGHGVPANVAVPCLLAAERFLVQFTSAGGRGATTDDSFIPVSDPSGVVRGQPLDAKE
jgi:hypothetical protein